MGVVRILTRRALCLGRGGKLSRYVREGRAGASIVDPGSDRDSKRGSGIGFGLGVGLGLGLGHGIGIGIGLPAPPRP